MSKEQKEILNLVLDRFPFYGDFTIVEKFKEIKDVEFEAVFNFVTNPDEQSLNLTNYLVQHGYAIRRKDLNTDETSIELTERGRWLKQQGSFEAYETYQEEKKSRRKAEELEIIATRERNKQMNRFTFWIAIATIISAVYYSLEILNHFFGFYCH